MVGFTASLEMGVEPKLNSSTDTDSITTPNPKLSAHAHKHYMAELKIKCIKILFSSVLHHSNSRLDSNEKKMKGIRTDTVLVQLYLSSV